MQLLLLYGCYSTPQMLSLAAIVSDTTRHYNFVWYKAILYNAMQHWL